MGCTGIKGQQQCWWGQDKSSHSTELGEGRKVGVWPLPLMAVCELGEVYPSLSPAFLVYKDDGRVHAALILEVHGRIPQDEARSWWAVSCPLQGHSTR